MSPGLRGNSAPARAGGHSSGGEVSLVPCDARVAGGGGLWGRVHLCAPLRDVRGRGLPGALRFGAV